jgi:hypothetical protein
MHAVLLSLFYAEGDMAVTTPSVPDVYAPQGLVIRVAAPALMM